MKAVATAVLVVVVVGMASGAAIKQAEYWDWDRSVMHFCDWPKAYDLSRIQPTFWARTKNSSHQFVISSNDQIEAMVDTLRQEGLVGRKTVFIIHGFIDNVKSAWMTTMADALLKVEDYLVFVIGWGKGADLYLRFAEAAANTQTVASAVAYATKNLKASNVPYTYCIGHSLGAHICGQAGVQVQFDRISGLDPAGPGFENCSHIGLRPTSADCVDVIHTNGEWDGFGTLQPLGHVDFYPNCGREQPGCWTSFDIGCSHGRAIDYFTDSITAHIQPVTKCPSSQGPCDRQFIDHCQACSAWDKCVESQPHCQGPNEVSQSLGYGSVCNEQKRPTCGSAKKSLDSTEYFGQWYVPVSKNGLMSYCSVQ